MVLPYTQQQIAEFTKAFKSLPTYKNDARGGSIRSSDSGAMFKHMNYNRSPAEVQAYVAYLDNKNNGILPFEEFLEVIAIWHDPAAIVKKQAERFDLDGDGFISSDEFKLMLPVLEVHESRFKGVSFERFLKEADANNDGHISIKECGNWISEIMDKKN